MPFTVPNRADYDSPWKKTLEVYFKEFIDFFFREMAADVDWSQEHVFLDKELQQVAREAPLGRSLRPVGFRPPARRAYASESSESLQLGKAYASEEYVRCWP